MQFTLTTAFAVLAAILGVAAVEGDGSGPLTIYTLTSPTACEPVQFTWSGGKAPYYLSLIPGGQPAAAALQQFPIQEGNAMTWIVSMPAGTTFSSALKDSTGAMAYSDSQTVQSGPDISCIEGSSNPMPVANAASTVASRATSAAATNTAAPNAAAPSAKPGVAQAASAAGPSSQSAQVTGTPTVVQAAGVPRPSIATSGSGTGTQLPASAAPANVPNRNVNGAGATGGSFGLVGLLGFLGAALLW